MFLLLILFFLCPMTAQATLRFSNNFNDGTFGTPTVNVDQCGGNNCVSPFFQSVPNPGAISVVTAPVREGAHAEVHIAKPGQNAGFWNPCDLFNQVFTNNKACDRSESEHAISYLNNETEWYGFSVRISGQTQYTDKTTTPAFHDPNGQVVFQAHQLGGQCPSAFGPRFVIYFRQQGGSHFWAVNDAQNNVLPACATAYPGGASRTFYDLNQWIPDQWTDFVIHAKWATNGTGILQIWRDGALLVDRSGLINSFNGFGQTDVKWGVYQSWWTVQAPPAGEISVVYHDNIRVSDGVGCSSTVPITDPTSCYKEVTSTVNPFTPLATVPPTINTWVSLPSTTILAVCPPNNFNASGYNYTTNCPSVTAASSSAVIDQASGTLYFHGGGGANYSGNEVYKLDTGQYTMARLNNPSTPPAASGSPDCIGTPCVANSVHTYDGLVWMEAQHQFLRIGGAAAPGGGFLRSIWTFDPATSTWARLSGNLSTSGPGVGGDTKIIGVPVTLTNAVFATAYDEANSVVYITDYHTLYSFDPAANTLRSLTSVDANLSSVMTMMYDPVRKVVVVLGGGNFGTWDVSAGPFAQVPVVSAVQYHSHVSAAQTAGASTLIAALAPGLQYDPDVDSAAGRWVAWGSVSFPNNIYKFDPVKALADDTTMNTTVTTTGAPSPDLLGAGTNLGVFGRWKYVRTARTYFYCGSVATNCWALRITAPDNTMVIRDKSGSTQTNRPVTQGRAFRPGDIQNCPEAWVGTTGLQTQTDVKSRWPDGSMKFGLVSFIVPTIPANSSTTVTLVNASNCNNVGALTPALALAAGFDFDVKMTVVGSTTKTASARQMLTDGAQRPWALGPIMTEYIIEGRSAARTYDMDPNGDGARALHPIFDCRFYPSNNKSECSDTLEDAWISNTSGNSARDEVISSYSLTSGSSAPVARAVNWNGDLSESFATNKFTGLSRAHIVTPGGPTALGAILVDQNLAYLVTTKLFNNFDTSLTLNATYLTTIGTDWTSAPRTIQGAFTGNKFVGNWQRVGSNIAAPWVGLHPTWDVQYLYNMSNQTLHDKSFGNADLYGRNQIHLRELDGAAGNGQFYDNSYSSAHTNPLGRPISIAARQQVSTQDFTATCGGTIGVDQMNFAGPVTAEWTSATPHIGADHAPSSGMLQYLLSGWLFYMEEAQFQGAYYLAWPAGCTSSPRQGDKGYLSVTDGINSLAWMLRSLAQAYAVSPDASPEQAYFQWYFAQNLAILEGQTDTPISNTAHQAAWDYGHTTVRVPDNAGNSGVSPLGALYQRTTDGSNLLRHDGTPSRNAQTCNGAGFTCATSPVEENYLLLALGEAQDFGLDTTAFRRFRARYNLGIVSGGTTTQYFMDQLLMPGRVQLSFVPPASGEGWLPRWDTSTYEYVAQRTSWNVAGGSDQQNEYVALGALAQFGDISGVFGLDGVTAYNIIRPSMESQLGLISRFNGTTNTGSASLDSPKWALLPRVSPATMSAVIALPPDLPSNVTVVIQ